MDVAGLLGGLVGGVLGLGALRIGWSTWKGVELPSVGRALAHPEHRRTLLLGGRTLYQTWHGAGAAMLAGGPALALIGFGLALVSVVAPGEDPWWW